MTRARFVKTFGDLVAFVGVLGSKLGSAGSTELSVQAHEDDTGGAQQETELWGHAPLLYQPLAGAEAMVVELGDERVVFATKDRRWQIQVKGGEVALRALGESAAYVLLKPDGTCTIEAKAINLGTTGGQLVALSNLVEAAISKAIAGHTHAGVQTGGGTTATGVLSGAVSSTAASRTKAV